MASWAGLKRHVAGLRADPPMEEFVDYDEYWQQRDDTTGMLQPRWVIAATMIPPGASVLDVGAGSGEFAQFLRSKNPTARIATADGSGRAVGLAREAGFDAVQLDLSIDDIEGHYDYVTCFEVIEHIVDAEGALRRLAAAGDHLIVSVPNVGFIGCRLRLAVFGRFPVTNCVHHIKEHVRFWTRHDFELWVEPFGLTVKSVRGHYGLSPLHRIWPGLFASGIVYELERRS